VRLKKKRKVESPGAVKSGRTNQIPPDKMTHSYNTRFQKKIREATAAREAYLAAVRRAEQRHYDQGMCDLCEEKPVVGFHFNNYDAVCEDCMNC
jgi:hypothetical protein